MNDPLPSSIQNEKLESNFENKLNIEKKSSKSPESIKKIKDLKKGIEQTTENNHVKKQIFNKHKFKIFQCANNSVKDENGFIYYKCRFCGITFNYITTLKAHERVHNISQVNTCVFLKIFLLVQPYTCNKCGEAFHYMCELEYHAKQHLGKLFYNNLN